MMLRGALWPSEGDRDAIIHAAPTECPMGDFSNDTFDESIIEVWNRRASPSQVAPANPAQVMELIADLEQAVLDFEDASSATYNRSKAELVKARTALTAAIGADGQAVAYLIEEAESRVVEFDKDEAEAAKSDGYEVRPLYTHPAPSGQAVAVKPLIWEEDHGIAGMGPYRLFKAETPLGRFAYGTDSEGSAYYHTASSGVMMVGNEATAKRLAEAAWEKVALAEVGKFVDPSALPQPHPADERVVEALERMVALYESEYDADAPFVRPDWLIAALSIAPATADGWRTKAVDDVLAERKRQIEVEGWTPEHDDMHDKGELARAAGLYALIAGADATDYRNARDGYGLTDYLAAVMKEYWPFNRSWFKPTNRRRDLVKAGGLIIGEIERLDRLPAAPTATGGR